MKRLALSLLLLLIAPAYAVGPSMVGTQLYPTGAHPSYTGPGDTTAFTFWCGMRAYSAATAGTKAIQLRKVSNSAVQDINTISTPGPTFGQLDTASATTFCSGSTCTVAKCYDKVGTNDLIQATTASQPGYTASCINSLPCINPSFSTPGLVSAGSVTPATGVVSLTIVYNRSAGTSTANGVCNANACADTRLQAQVANTYRMQGGSTISATAADGTAHSIQGVQNGAGSALYVDGSATTGSSIGPTTAGTINAFAGAALTTTYAYGEAGFTDNVAWTSGTAAAIRANQKAYWGTP